MLRAQSAIRLIATLALGCGLAPGQTTAPGRPLAAPVPPGTAALTVVDEHGVAVAGAQVAIEAPGRPAERFTTDYAGHCEWPEPRAGYSIRVSRPGYYEAAEPSIEPGQTVLRVVLTQEQMLQQEVNVRASTPGIDPEQVSDRATLAVADVVNIPFPDNRDIRNLLPFIPQVVADFSGQVHVAGGETYMTLDTLDGFDMRSPVYGTLDVRVSTDAVRSLDTETTRYPVEYGRATGGIIAYTTGMGDNKFRYNATDFIPSFRQQNGIRFDKFVPRFTVSGPVVRNRAWFFDGIEAEYDENYTTGLPANADTNHLARGGNLLKFQVNPGATNSLTAALLANGYHSPYEGLSPLVPQVSTDNHDIIAWLPYVRDDQSFRNGVMLDSGFGIMRYREGWEPHGTVPYALTPEAAQGSNFENLTERSQRLEGYENVYFPARHWLGSHQLRTGVDLDHVGFNEDQSLAPVNYLREDRSLLRQSTFPHFAPFSRNNLELGWYGDDRWKPARGLLLVSGLRFDWDEIIRRPLWSPRIAATYTPPGSAGTTRLSAGVGLYYEHTQLEYLTRALAGIRYDTYYAADGTTPVTPPLETRFTINQGSLREAHALNWSVGVEHKLPGSIYAGANFMQKRLTDGFVYTNEDGTGAQPGTYLLTNQRQDHYYAAEIEARRTFSGGYTLFAAYTRSSAVTNAALDYMPTVSIAGQQQSGPLLWDTPNRVVSWGWLPAWAPWLPSVRKNWDFVYTARWNTGFPVDSVDANQALVGTPGSHRFPDYLSLSPGLEWRFHFHGKYFGLRGTLDNATNSQDPYVVINSVASPQYLTFSQPLGRAFTTRIRLIESSK